MINADNLKTIIKIKSFFHIYQRHQRSIILNHILIL